MEKKMKITFKNKYRTWSWYEFLRLDVLIKVLENENITESGCKTEEHLDFKRSLMK